EIPVEDANTSFSSVVIPGKSLNELSKILDDTEESIDISVTDNQVLFRTKQLNFLSRLLDGNYPETSRQIQEERKTVIQIITRDISTTIDRAALLAKEDRNNVIRLTTIEGNTAIQISSNSPEIGHVEEEMAVDSISGEELKISFSSKYM